MHVSNRIGWFSVPFAVAALLIAALAIVRTDDQAPDQTKRVAQIEQRLDELAPAVSQVEQGMLDGRLLAGHQGPHQP